MSHLYPSYFLLLLFHLYHSHHLPAPSPLTRHPTTVTPWRASMPPSSDILHLHHHLPSHPLSPYSPSTVTVLLHPTLPVAPSNNHHFAPSTVAATLHHFHHLTPSMTTVIQHPTPPLPSMFHHKGWRLARWVLNGGVSYSGA